jgi:predicted outer membrane protein
MSPSNTLLLLVALWPAVLVAQSVVPVPEKGDKPVAAVDGGRVAPAEAASDDVLAQWVHVVCTNEAKLAAIAVKQGQSEGVRSFAQKVIDEHTAFAVKLEPFVRGAKDKAVTTLPVASGKQPVDASAVRPAAPFDHAVLIRELGAKCLQSATKKLAARSTSEFDDCYLRMTTAAHGQGVDLLEVLSAHASPQLRAVLADGHKMVVAHLKHATEMAAKEQSGDDEGRDSRKAERGGR